ncbi:unnamed protein product [Larinioides sclopetarius]|uniref:Uncharacterized protein n=1 Tax=Larinioides sclopetarius TaxID=280406 RepID=A0AAV2AAE3_9ARAC
MPKNIWTTKRRKKNRKGKSSESEPDAETIERSRMLDPNEPSISIGRISDLFINVPVKIEEEVIYPDTRFQRSTTLFPAEVVEDEISPGIPNKTFKRSAEDELISAMPKKERMSDPSTTIKSTTSDDCMIIENTKTRVKVEVVDLTDDSHPIVPILCSPVKISNRENGQPDKTNAILPAIGDIKVKFEPSDKRNEIIVDAAGSESVSYRTIQTNAEQSKTSERNSEVNTDRTYVDLPIDSTSCIQVKTEKNMSSESESSFDSNTTAIYPVDRPIKSEQSKTNENCEKVDSQKITNSNNKNTCLVTSQTSIRNELNQINISPFTDGSIFSEDALLYEPVSFRTPLLKYLNCNTKVEVPEISNALSSLVNLIKETAEINAIESELIADPIDSQNKSELFLVEKGEELPNLRENQKQSLKIDEILNKISSSNFIELVDLKPSITNLSQLEKSINEEQVQRLLNNKGLIDETRQSNSPQILFESHPKVSESSVKRWSQVAEKRGDLEANEKESLNVEDILYKISLPNFTESMLKPNITNLDSNSAIQFENSINEKEIQSPLNSDGLVDEMRQNISPMPNDSNLSESSQDSDSHTIYFNSPMDIENFPEDKSPSIICLSSLDENERNASSSNSPIEEKNNYNEYFPNYLLRQIIGNAKSTEKSDDITEYSSLLKPAVGPVAKSDAIIDGSFLLNLHQIRLPKKKPVEIVNFTTDVKEKNSKNTVKNSGNFSAVPPKNVKPSHSVHFKPSTTCGGAVQTSSKRLKISEDESISKSGSVNKLGYEEYRKDIRKTASPHYSPDHLFSNYLGPDILSKSPNSSLGASSFGHNILTTPSNSHNSSLPVCSETSLQNPVYPHLVNISSPQDPRLAHNYSRATEKDVNSQKQLVSFNISQTCPSQNNPDVTNLPVYPHMNQLASASTTYAMPNFSRVLLTPAELFGPTINAMQIQQVEQMLPHMNSFQPHYLNQQTSMNNSNVFSSPVSESISFCMAQYNLHQSVQGVRDQQPFLSLLNMPGNISSPSQYHYSVSQEIPPPISKHDTLSFDNYSSESVNYGFGLNPPLPDSIPPPPPPLPLTPPPIVEHPHSIASNISPRSSFHNKKLAAAKNLSMPNQPSSKFLAPKPSLLPNDLREDIGKNIIQNNDFYLIIIERNIDWIHGIDKDVGIPRITEIGGEFQQVRNIYRNHLVYYNTYFPLLLLECFSKISMALKAAKQKEKKDRNICKIIQSETKQNYVSLTCDSFVRHSDMDSIPKDGHIILVKFGAFREGNVRMLGYVCSSATRSYSHRHDHGNEILKYVNVNKRTDLIKIRINFYIVFGISDINLEVPIHVSKLSSIKKALLLNDALKELRRSPLCDAILGLRNNIKNFVLPRRQDTNAMTTVVQEIVQSLSPLSSQLTIVKSAPFADSFLAIVQIVEEIRKSKMPGKILVCVRSEILCQMGMNLMETSSNVVIINRERESVHEKLHSRVLDVMMSHVATARNISDALAKIKVLQEAEVLLAVTGNCFYEDVQSLARDLAFCIMHDAHSFTEPETLLPLLYGIRHLLLFGDPDESCIVNSKCSASLGYNKSLFHRAYNLC